MHMARPDQFRESIQLLLNDEPITLDSIDPTTSVLNFLREDRRLSGTKEGCAEGDCGACTIVLAELVDKKLKLKTVNACIQFVPTLDGKAIFTVEYLRRQAGKLHPVQQAMIDEHGSQCGFCTPGFVMSLWNLYNRHQVQNSRPQMREIRSALTGNLCRCTGYRPILSAAQRMFDYPAVSLDVNALTKKLKNMQNKESLRLCHEDKIFFAPGSVSGLVSLKAEYPSATLLAGGTDIGLWVNKQFRDINPIIYIGEVDELKRIEIDEGELHIGAGVSLSDTYRLISKYYPEMNQIWERFASQPIRNTGTIGGNVANGSPIGDSMPALIALGSSVVLRGVKGTRTLALEDLYLDYMKKDMAADEIVDAVKLPRPAREHQFRCYKLSKRFDSDISAVFAAFRITLSAGKVVDCRIAYGGMAAIPKRAGHCERFLIGKSWHEPAVRQAMQLLKQDYSPMTDMRASEQNRMQSAMNLLYRFYLETRSENPLPANAVDVFSTAVPR